MSRSRPLRIALTLWITVAITISVRTLIHPNQHTVFPILVAGSDHWWHGEPLYADYKPLDFFRYPPALAVILTPFAALGLRAGGVLWGLVNLCVFGVGLWAFARRALPVRWSDARLATFYSLALFGAVTGLWNGQSNALIAGLLLLGVTAVIEDRWWPAALYFAIALTIKPTVIAPILLLCAIWPIRLTPKLILLLAILLALPFLTRSPDVVINAHREWVAHLLETSTIRWPGYRDAFTVWQAIRETGLGRPVAAWLRDPLDSTFYRILQLATAFSAFLWTQWLARLGMSRSELVVRIFAIGLAWTMLFGPAIEQHTYVMLAPFLCWGLLEPGVDAWKRGFIIAAFVLIMIIGLDDLVRPIRDKMPLVLAALPVGTACFTVWLALNSRPSKQPTLSGAL